MVDGETGEMGRRGDRRDKGTGRQGDLTRGTRKKTGLIYNLQPWGGIKLYSHSKVKNQE
ncbi:MAG: hypothetical protein AAFY16_01490 [Cyanobacteria bacterium J06642_3]